MIMALPGGLELKKTNGDSYQNFYHYLFQLIMLAYEPCAMQTGMSKNLKVKK